MAGSRVETISRLAQWRIENFGRYYSKKSDPFKVSIWNWQLSVERNGYFYIRLFPEPSCLSKEQLPTAKFFIRVSRGGMNSLLFLSLQLYTVVHERSFRTGEDFVWYVERPFVSRFIIDVEFVDLKICPPSGGEAYSIWPSDEMMQSVSSQSTLRRLSRMLDEGIHTDVVIHTADGTLKAHKAVLLVASSPVFQSMFHHDLKEKESSTIYIQDMSLESFMALLSYLYATIKPEGFWKHRLALLGAANKYDIVDLKNACEDSLLEDINSGNVLERLQEAWLYPLNKLKKGCLASLFHFGKIYDVLFHASRPRTDAGDVSRSAYGLETSIILRQIR